MADPVTGGPPEKVHHSGEWAAITKSDTVDIKDAGGNFRVTRAIYVGGAGTVRAVDINGRTCDFLCVAGTILPISARRIQSAGTDATSMVAMF